MNPNSTKMTNFSQCKFPANVTSIANYNTDKLTSAIMSVWKFLHTKNNFSNTWVPVFKVGRRGVHTFGYHFRIWPPYTTAYIFQNEIGYHINNRVYIHSRKSFWNPLALLWRGMRVVSRGRPLVEGWRASMSLTALHAIKASIAE